MEENESGIVVVCRIRPLSETELVRSRDSCIEISKDNRNLKINSRNESNELTFTLDYIFPQSCSQEEVYTIAAKPAIASVFEGFNGAILAYGQTSSGKTYTMIGEETPDSSKLGIIPRIVNEIFINIEKSSDSQEFTVKVSYLEIYLEKIRDLIDPSRTNLNIQEDKLHGMIIPQLTEYSVSNAFEVYDLLTAGKGNRETGMTMMNESSSRSHAIFLITISQNNLSDYSARSGRLYLVDLAGSEKVGKTGAVGKRLEEAKNINKSLTSLGLVITALTEAKGGHVPYRDSKLTRVLQDSLGGNAKTTLILACSPSFWNEDETISTLRFGVRAKAVRNKPKVNRELTVSELKLMLIAAKEEIKKKERVIEEIRGEMGKGGEEEQALSLISFTSVDLSDSVREIEKIKESLSGEVCKNNGLVLENAEKQILIEREKKENARLHCQIAVHSDLNRDLYDQIKAKDECIKVHSIQNAYFKSENESLVKKIEKLEQCIQVLSAQNTQKEAEMKNMYEKIKSLQQIEMQSASLQSCLENERFMNSRLEQENSFLMEKIQEKLKENMNFQELEEKLTVSTEFRIKEKWLGEKRVLLEEIEQYLETVMQLKLEIGKMRRNFDKVQQNLSASQIFVESTIKDLSDSNIRAKDSYEQLSKVLLDICAEKQNNYEKSFKYSQATDLLEDKLQMYNERIGMAEEQLALINRQIQDRRSYSYGGICLPMPHIRRVIKGGRQLSNASFSPVKDHIRTNSDFAFIELLEENEEN